MKPTLALVLRVAFAVGVAFTLIKLAIKTPSLISGEKSWEVPTVPNKSTVDEPFENTPVQPPEEADPLMTPFGHAEHLYTDCPNNDTTACLEFLARTEPKQMPNTNEKLLVIHTAWAGGMVPVHQFLLYSYLATQHLNKSMLIYWLEHSKYENFTSNSLLTPFMNHPNIVFKCLNLTDLARDTPLDLSLNKLGERRLAAIRLLGATGPLWGDLVRMLILYKYGGIYVDVDVILLRPMNPFLANEFAYSWASQGYMNTAVFSLKRGGNIVQSLFNRTLVRKYSNFHPRKLYASVVAERLPLVIYPSAYFDPVWNIDEKNSPQNNLPYKTFTHFFNTTVKGEFNFWNGAYAYHFHNQYYLTRWREDSWAGRLLTQFKEQIRNKTYISYDFSTIQPDLAALLEPKCKNPDV